MKGFWTYRSLSRSGAKSRTVSAAAEAGADADLVPALVAVPPESPAPVANSAIPFASAQEGLELASAAMNSGDSERALALWAEVRDHYPECEEAYLSAGVALRQFERLDEAEAVLKAGAETFPTNPRLAVGHAQLAFHVRDWPEALRRFERVQQHFPLHPWGFIGTAAVLRETGQADAAEVLLAEGVERLPRNKEVLIAHARAAQQRRDWQEAARRWDLVRQRFPREPDGHIGAVATERDAGRLDQAAKLAIEAGKASGMAPMLKSLGAVASSQKNWPLAVQLWSAACKELPEDPQVRLSLAAAEEGAGDVARAEAVLAIAIERFGRTADLAIAYARVAAARRDWPEALRRWMLARDCNPDRPAVEAGVGAALRMSGRFDEADASLSAAIGRFPDNMGLALEHAWLAQFRRDWPSAAVRWRAVLDRSANVPAAYSGLGIALREQGTLDEAETVLQEGRQRFPGNIGIETAFGNLLNARRDWTRAGAHWEALRTRAPDDREVLNGLGQAKWNIQFDSFEQPGSTPAANHAAAAPSIATGSQAASFLPQAEADLPAAELFKQFESLGDNCEFGLVQRHFGIEPIGLLRWTGTPPLKVANAIDAGFEGLGDPANTELTPFNSEYLLKDTKYGVLMHTFIRQDESQYKRTYDLLCRRLRYLKDKMLEDLETAEKIFVCRSRYHFTDAIIGQLHRAVRRRGNNSLLCIQLASGENFDRRVKLVEPGLFMGYIDRLGPRQSPVGEVWDDLSYESWHALCRETYRLWQADKPHAVP